MSEIRLGSIEAGGTKFVLAVTDGDYNVLLRKRVPTTTPEDTLAAAIKVEKDALAERQKVKEHQRDRLKDYIRQAMGLAGKKKVETPRNCVSVGKAQPKAVITDLDALQSRKDVWKPYDYSKETNVDKTSLKALLQSGEQIPGAALQGGAPRLTIK